MRWYFGERAVSRQCWWCSAIQPSAPLHSCVTGACQDVGGFSPSTASSLLMACAAGEFGWPTSSILKKVPETDEEKTQLIDTLQDWKTLKYQEIVCERASPSSAPCIGSAD